jgi:hypothetical protein
MLDTLRFVSAFAVTLLISLAVMFYMKAPLRRLLLDLCGNPQRSDFWVAFSNVTVVLLPVIFAMPSDTSPYRGPITLGEICVQLKWGLAGLIISVLILGWVLGRSIRRIAPRS